MFLTLTGLAIAGLVALGVALTAGGIVIGVGASEDKKEKERQKQALTDEINKQNSNYNELYATRQELQDAVKKIDSAKSYFKNGGHVLDGKALAEKEINECRGVVSDTISYLDAALKDIQNNIKILEEQKSKL